MAVNAQAQGQGNITVGGALGLGQIGTTSPAAFSAGLFVILLAIVVLVVIGLR